MQDDMAPLARICLFVASFSPLWFIVIVSYLLNPEMMATTSLVDGVPDVAIASSAVAVPIVCCIVRACSIVSDMRTSTNTETVMPAQVRDETHAHAPSVMVYVFFVAIGIASPHNIIALIALAAFVCIVFSRTNMILNNPSLLIVGFRIYSLKVTDPDRSILLVAKRPPFDGKGVRIKMVAPGVFIDGPDAEEDEHPQ